MEMHQVRYFLAVADKLNFTRAAEKCAVTQPALTRAIQLLEIELGGLLFHRERANTQLTELGRMMCPHLEHIYGKTQETRRLAKEYAQIKGTKLKLGIMCTIAPDQIVELIGCIRTRHSSVELQLCDANAWDLQKQLLDGTLEIAIYCLPGREPEARMHVMPLFRERIVIAINPRHRLANLSAIRVKDLDGESYIHRMNCEFAGYADPIFAAQNVNCKAAYWSDRDDWTLAMVAAGIGWAFMPEHSVKHPAVLSIPVTEPEFWREVNLVSVRGRAYAPPVGALVREAMSAKWFGEKALAVSRAAQASEHPASISKAAPARSRAAPKSLPP
jgi:LysR family hydrogen peroxide-inducible transcriptional activator